MNSVSEYEIIQNNALGSIILWNFVNGYYNKAQTGPIIPLLMTILPLVFHKKIRETLSRKHLHGGLFRAISEDRTLLIGLQQRIEDMSSQTFQSLNIGFASGLIDYNQNNKQIIPKSKTLPFKTETKEIQDMQKTAKKLGVWFATTNIEQLFILLRLRL